VLELFLKRRGSRSDTASSLAEAEASIRFKRVRPRPYRPADGAARRRVEGIARAVRKNPWTQVIVLPPTQPSRPAKEAIRFGRTTTSPSRSTMRLRKLVGRPSRRKEDDAGRRRPSRIGPGDFLL